ncbi:MAG: tetratricopeptide repeat protein [Acidobacteriota bacterium]|jgi:tetratricopeptide (TPR) repeat protein|nr:tetratricopeptide repeat protein [Acidobacteriota bacterium]
MKYVAIRRFRRPVCGVATAALLAWGLTAQASAQARDGERSARKPVLIIDTDLAEEEEGEGGGAGPEPVRERNPLLAKQNLDVGNTYFKRRNYTAAISRYIEAISWQQDSIPAHEALARAYEKVGDLTRAILTLQALIEKNPDSPENKGLRAKIEELESKR